MQIKLLTFSYCGQNAESIADHMYRMSIITMLCPPEEGIDKDRCVKLALIHDMAEALVGDITPPDKVPKGMHTCEWL